MSSISKLVFLLIASAMVNAAVLPREERTSNVVKLLKADPFLATVPDLSVYIVTPSTTDVRGDVEDFTDLAVDVILAKPKNDAFSVNSISTDELATDSLLFSVSLFEFLGRKAALDPSSLDWTDDGCSYSPDEPLGYNFLHSCMRHDFGYRNFKAQSRFTEENRERIDDKFLNDLYNECANYWGFSNYVCEGLADTYYAAVREFGNL